MKKLLVFMALLPFIGIAQNYAVSLIPDSLKENANAVKRSEDIYITIKSIGKASVKHKVAVTILNESGELFSEYENYYDKLHSISEISGKLFDAQGKLLKTIKKKEIADVSMKDDESLMTDARIKRFSFYNRNYPYTVEFEDEEVLDGVFALPRWTPLDDENLSVQQSRLIVETPLDYKLRYQQFNYSNSPDIKTNKTIIYTWGVENQKAIEFEKWQPPLHEVTSSVYLAPTEFEYAGYKGSSATWFELGKFQIELNKQRDVLPEDVKKQIHQIADNLSTKEEKVTALYEFMQKNTRYISVQLGIGGLQPFEAKYVAEKKYGDCKALSNYMVSILKEAGIKSYYTLIYGGSSDRHKVIEDLPTDYFNHIVTCVPNGKDTIWLECTNQTVSAGYMGMFTGNRKALMIGEDGGYLVSTPNLNAGDNLMVRKINVEINPAGNAVMDVNTKFTGLQQELQHSLMHDATKEQKEKYLNTILSLPTYKVEKIEYKQKKGNVPQIDEYLKINVSNYASVTGKRLFVTPDIFDIEKKLPNEKSRKFNFISKYAYRDIDSVHIQIPEGYDVEAMPKNVEIKNKYGEYKINYQVNGNVIELYRFHEELQGEYPPSEYETYVKYYESMSKADNARIVFVKK